MPRSLSDLTSAQAVQAALDEYFLVGRDAFLERYGYRRSRSYLVVDPRTGLEADSKAIAGVALGKQYPDPARCRAQTFPVVMPPWHLGCRPWASWSGMQVRDKLRKTGP